MVVSLQQTMSYALTGAHLGSISKQSALLQWWKPRYLWLLLEAAQLQPSRCVITYNTEMLIQFADTLANTQ